MSKPSVLVAGDVFIDHVVYAGHERRPDSTLQLGTAAADLRGGAALLADVLTAFLPGAAVALAADEATQAAWPRAFAVFDRFPAGPAAADKRPVWRMREALGFAGAPVDVTAFAAEEGAGRPDVVVLDDAGLDFRREAARPAWPAAIRDETAEAPDWVVLQGHAPLAAGDLWHHLTADPRGLAKRCVAVVPCPEVRAEQVRVTPGLSWERAAVDLAGEFRRHPMAALGKCRFVVVRFDTDGALLADFTAPAAPAFRLLFDPANLEGDWAARTPGRVYGYHTVFTAAVAAALAAVPHDAADAAAHIEKGIAAGLSAARRLAVAGHGPAAEAPAFPFAALAQEVAKPTWAYSAASVPVGNPKWSIAAASASRPLFGLARRVALKGVSALAGLPFQQFGKLFIVDRKEIESLRGLHRLVTDYARLPRADKPLSIAVFGAPGSGKSFGVKELTRAVLKGDGADEVPILEFNLAQFDGPADLLGMLHQVRDKVLEGRMPVVFWDEFDSKKLMWLQYLLAPMQDGRVQDGQVSHPIGKCLFVFAGGTSHEFAGFGPPAADAEAWQAFRDAKGPDFKSRLSGYLDVLGPNPRRTAAGPDPADVNFPVRRALLLRAKMGLSGADRLAVEPGLLSAFLEIGQYTHGARSMEKIVEQTRAAAGHGRAGRSHLPPPQLLSLHVDADEFLTLAERDLAFQADAEPMAEAYHEFYREKFGGDEHTGKPFADLAEFLKDDNRAAARRIGEVLGGVGLYVVPAHLAKSAAGNEDVGRVIEDNLDLLAEAEHDGWAESRRRNGWTPCAEKSMARRTHSSLKPFAALTEREKQKDRDAVLRYADIVAKANYRIVTGPPPRRDDG